MPKNLKKLFSYTLILLLFTACMPRQINEQYPTQYSYTPYYTKIPHQQKIYQSSSNPRYNIQYTPKQTYHIPNRVKKESAFEKILRQSKQKKLKLKKIKRNSCREEFPSNVPRNSIH